MTYGFSDFSRKYMYLSSMTRSKIWATRTCFLVQNVKTITLGIVRIFTLSNQVSQ